MGQGDIYAAIVAVALFVGGFVGYNMVDVPYYGATPKQVAEAKRECELTLPRTYECKPHVVLEPALKEFKN